MVFRCVFALSEECYGLLSLAKYFCRIQSAIIFLAWCWNRKVAHVGNKETNFAHDKIHKMNFGKRFAGVQPQSNLLIVGATFFCFRADCSVFLLSDL